MYRIEQCAKFCDHSVFGSAKMRHILKADLLQAMKESLRDLENLRLLSPNDLEILTLRRNLERLIAVLERLLRVSTGARHKAKF